MFRPGLNSHCPISTIRLLISLKQHKIAGIHDSDFIKLRHFHTYTCVSLYACAYHIIYKEHSTRVLVRDKKDS